MASQYPNPIGQACKKVLQGSPDNMTIALCDSFSNPQVDLYVLENHRK